MLFYHGTSEENWLKIQEEGILFGKRDFGISRCTYLAKKINEARCYGKVILSVEYDPFLDKDNNNYIEGCWQFRVYSPISIDNVKRIE